VRKEKLSSRFDKKTLAGRSCSGSLEENFRTTQSVSGYAKLLKISSDRLGKAVQERSGRPAGEIIRQRLLLEAERLLAHTEMTVSEIAYGLNFQDPAYFSRFFRRLTGQSPGEFRQGLPEKYQESLLD
jgi:AraC family transcriptional regulator, transcriptional activator of pobA